MAYVEKGTCDMHCDNLAVRMFSKVHNDDFTTIFVLCNRHADDEHDALIAGGYAEELFW